MNTKCFGRAYIVCIKRKLVPFLINSQKNVELLMVKVLFTPLYRTAFPVGLYTVLFLELISVNLLSAECPKRFRSPDIFCQDLSAISQVHFSRPTPSIGRISVAFGCQCLTIWLLRGARNIP